MPDAPYDFAPTVSCGATVSKRPIEAYGPLPVHRDERSHVSSVSSCFVRSEKTCRRMPAGAG
jgi:hypothetical protein